MTDSEFRSGFAVLVGRPNVGKSTLINAIVGEKIAIVADKPQTTRNRILGVAAGQNYQLVLVDTPGIHRPHHLLGESMVQTAIAAIEETEAILLVVDATETPGPGDRYVAEFLGKTQTPAFCVVNKADLLPADGATRAMEQYARLAEFKAVVAVSALTGQGVPELVASIVSLLPPGPMYFPAGTVTDQPASFIAAETVREKLIALTEEEVPHSIAVEVQEMAKRPNGMLIIRCQIYVERASQRGIILGAGGMRLKEAGRLAREDLEKLFGDRIYLELWVKVKPDWRNQQRDLKDLGYR